MENTLENVFHVRLKQMMKPFIVGGITNKYSVYQTEEDKVLFVKRNSNLEVNNLLLPI